MNLLRGLLLDNLGLKLVALLMAVLVYMNVYTDRPATMLVTFPLAYDELPDSLSLSGPVPTTVQAELRGTGKQLIKLRLTEPRVRISLAGVSAGSFERAVGADDLPISPDGDIKLERLVGPRVLQLELERRLERMLPVRVRVEGEPAGGSAWPGVTAASPAIVRIAGPRRAVAALDTVDLAIVRIDGRRDTVRTQVAGALPEWCSMDPATVSVTIPITRQR